VIDGGVRSTAEIRYGFAEVAESRPGALIILVDGVTLSNKDLIIELVRSSGLPAIYQVRDFVDAGGLMSYGLKFCQHFARVAFHANSILRWSKPADIPVELPTTFELVINNKAAQALGLTVPSLLPAGADEVIE
jgi:putative ABC transport system substrate-binding protein